ncbi:MAG TPA: hypothetical protein VGJ59_16260 [Jatrophihabitantaceae bacterium]|jgi:hypothetical protein
MTSQEEPQPRQPNVEAAAQPPTPTPSEGSPAAQAQAQQPQTPPVQPPPPMQPPPYPFAPVPKLPWIAPARKAAVIAIGVAAGVLMFGAGIGAGAAIFHNDQHSQPRNEFRIPGDGQRQFPGFPNQLPTPGPTPSRTS